MPIYEYQCSKCGHKFEKIQGFNDEPLKKCPECGQNKLEKCLSAPNFQLKGSGWYETDFKKKRSDESSSSNKPAAKKEESAPKKSKETHSAKDSN